MLHDLRGKTHTHTHIWVYTSERLSGLLMVIVVPASPFSSSISLLSFPKLFPFLSLPSTPLSNSLSHNSHNLSISCLTRLTTLHTLLKTMHSTEWNFMQYYFVSAFGWINRLQALIISFFLLHDGNSFLCLWHSIRSRLLCQFVECILLAHITLWCSVYCA